MSISFVNKSAFASGTAALSVGAVTGVVANDLILLYVESANQAITTPTGFTIVPSSPVSTGTAAAAGGVRLSVFYAFATGADTTTSVADSGDHTNAIKIAYRGVDSVTPFDATSTTGIKTPASTSSSFPSITTVSGNSLIVHASALDLDAASTATTGTPTNANLTGLIERHDQTVTSGLGGGLVIIDGTKVTAGATGATTATVTSTIQVYLTSALREEVDTGTLTTTEAGSDTFSASGSIANAVVSGPMASSETDSDTYSAIGTVAFAPISGSLAVSEIGSDTFISTGNVVIKGSLATSESGQDSFSSSGSVSSNTVVGSFSASESGSDNITSSGNVLVQGSLVSSESANDGITSTGLVLISGSASATELPDQYGSYATDAYFTDGYTNNGLEGRVLVSGSLASSESGVDSFIATSAESKANILPGYWDGGVSKKSKKVQDVEQDVVNYDNDIEMLFLLVA